MRFEEDKSSLISLKQMSYLVALAEYRSFSAAAGSLQMAQPSLSENIARLEKNFGVQLATRGARGIRMTEAGALLAQRSAEILAKVEGSIEEVRSLLATPKGPVTFALPPGLSLMLSVPLLETIHAEHPAIRMSITEGLSGDVLDWVQEGRINIGCAYDAYESADFTCTPLLTEEIFLVTAPDNWKGPLGSDGIAKDVISVKDLSELPLVMTSSRGAIELQQKVFSTSGYSLDVIATLNSLPQIVEMVQRASAYALLSHGSVYKQVSQGQLALVRIQGSILQRTAYLVTNQTRTISFATTIVEQYIKSLVPEIVQRHGISGAHPL